MNYRIIEPFFFQEAKVTSHSYLDMSEHYTLPQLPCDAWFQQDGEAPNFRNIVRYILNKRFPNTWTRRGGFAAWVAGLFSLGLCEECRVSEIRTVRRRITEFIATVPDLMLVNT
jgi:hypothetical protein